MLKLAESPFERRAVYYSSIVVSLVVVLFYLLFLRGGEQDLVRYLVFLGVMMVVIFLCGVAVGVRYAQAYALLVGVSTLMALARYGLLLDANVFFISLLYALVVIVTAQFVRHEETLLTRLELDIEGDGLKTAQSEKAYGELEQKAMAGDVKIDRYDGLVRMAGRINSLEDVESAQRLIDFMLQEIKTVIHEEAVVVSICLYPHPEQEGGKFSRAFGLPAVKAAGIQTNDCIETSVRRTKRPLMTSDRINDPRFSGEIKSAFRAGIAVPLTTTVRRQERSEVELIGIIRLDSPSAGAFSVAELRDLSNIGDLCSAAIVSTYLYLGTARQATIDLLTGLYVHRYFRERLVDEIIRAEKKKLPLGFMMCDIDHFKECNDRFGHVVGDKVLKMVAQELVKATRNVDFVARYGGEEFAVILPETKTRGLNVVAERIRSRIEKRRVKVVDEEVAVTISIGCASFPLDAATGEKLIGLADAALYRAKADGRNKVRFYDKKVDRKG